MVMKMKHYIGKLRIPHREEGMTLVELLVALGIVGVVLVAFAYALSTGAIAVAESDQEVTLQSLARSQMEYIKGYPFDSGATTYPTVNATDNYSISVAVSATPDADANIQKVTANISRDGQVLLTLEDYKVNR